MPAKLSQTIIDEVVALFQSGMKQIDIATKLNYSRQKVCLILKKSGIKKTEDKSRIRISAEQTQDIIDRYLSGQAPLTIYRDIGFSTVFIRKILALNNIPMRGLEDIRKRPINRHFFDVIDTEAKAYFLGFLYADGNIAKDNNTIKMQLHMKDEHILSTFSKLIYGEECIFMAYDPNHRIALVTSKHMKAQLIKHGCLVAKSLILTYPQIAPELERHFIRGYMDGDGSIMRHKNDFQVNFVGTWDFCNGLIKAIDKVLGITTKALHNQKCLDRGNTATSYISYSGARRAEKLLDWLYQDATYFLTRKHQTYQELKEWIWSVNLKKLVNEMMRPFRARQQREKSRLRMREKRAAIKQSH